VFQDFRFDFLAAVVLPITSVVSCQYATLAEDPSTAVPTLANNRPLTCEPAEYNRSFTVILLAKASRPLRAINCELSSRVAFIFLPRNRTKVTIWGMEQTCKLRRRADVVSLEISHFSAMD
jgi:hypothetical protein